MLINPRYDISQKKGKLYFLKLLQAGRPSHYQLEWIGQGETSISSMDLLKKDTDTFFIRATQGLLGLKRKVLSSYLADCPDLSVQIEDRSINSVQEIIDFYNRRCP
jgi:hypothetical protein